MKMNYLVSMLFFGFKNLLSFILPLQHVAQFVESRVNNRKIMKPWFNSQSDNASLYPWGQAVYRNDDLA